MKLTNLKLTNYKNYHQADIQFNTDVNVIAGDNGSGKTNLLDAIYNLSFCKSNFQHQDSLLINHSRDFFRIEGLYADSKQKLKVAIAFDSKKKKLIQAGERKLTKLSDHIGTIPLVFIGPRDIQLIFDGSVDRRKFLDSGISQLNKKYLQHLVHYNKVLIQRNAYLKSIQLHSYDSGIIDSYNNQLIEPATLIHAERHLFIESFKQTFQESYRVLSGGKEKASCAYKSQLDQSKLEQLLKDSLHKDVVLQRTTTGIHKDDLIFLLDERQLKKFGSEGQLKSYLLALKLSMWKELNKHSQHTPLLLLDDIFAKLDNHRVKNLLYFVREECSAQVFISDTHMTRVPDILNELNMEHKVFSVKNNEVNEAG